MRTDVITVDAPSLEWVGALSTLRTTTTRVHPQDFTVGSGARLASDLHDAAHNAWAENVFDTICSTVTADVELLDEDDNVIRSRHTATAS